MVRLCRERWEGVSPRPPLIPLVMPRSLVTTLAIQVLLMGKEGCVQSPRQYLLLHPDKFSCCATRMRRKTDPHRGACIWQQHLYSPYSPLAPFINRFRKPLFPPLHVLELMLPTSEVVPHVARHTRE